MIHLAYLRRIRADRKALAVQEPVASGLSHDSTQILVKPGTYHFKGDHSFQATMTLCKPPRAPGNHAEHEDPGRETLHEEVRLARTEQGFIGTVRGQVIPLTCKVLEHWNGKPYAALCGVMKDIDGYDREEVALAIGANHEPYRLRVTLSSDFTGKDGYPHTERDLFEGKRSRF